MTTNPQIKPDELYKLLGLDCRVHRYADRDAWKAARVGELYDRVGASELAALFGVGGKRRDSQYSLWSRRVDPAAWAEEVEDEADEMFWGRLVESLIIQQAGEQHGMRLFGWPQTEIVVANDWPGFATPDAIGVDDDGPFVAECKGWHESSRGMFADGPPLSVVLQSLQQQLVTGIHRGKIVVLFGNQFRKLGIYDVDYDESFATAIRERAQRFSGYVTSRTEPPIDESEMTAEAIFKLHPDDSGAEIDLPAESTAWRTEREQLKAEAKRIESRLEHIDNQLKASIGDATFGVTPDNGWFSWKTQSRTGIDRKKLAEEFPDAYQAVQTSGKCRVLLALKKPPKV